MTCGTIDLGFTGLSALQVVFLGLVQGLTELLPISSTAHMRVVPALLGWPDPGSAFSAAMQMAALLAIVCYFWADLRALAVGSAAALHKRDYADRHLRMAVAIALGTVPIVVGGLALSKLLNACNSPLRALEVIGAASIVMGALLVVAERRARHTRPFAKATLADALLVGLAQVGALIPGVSRSGATLTAALYLGFTRADAARFSFLLGLPAILLAGMKELYELHKAGLDAHGWQILGLGMAAGSVSAFAAIWTLLKVMEKFSSLPFAAYRIAMGAGLLLAVAMGWLG